MATTLASKMETASSSIWRLFAVEGHPPTFFLIDYCSSDKTTSSCLYRDIWLSNSMMVINHVSLLCQLQKMVLKMIPIAGFFNALSRFFKSTPHSNKTSNFISLKNNFCCFLAFPFYGSFLDLCHLSVCFIIQQTYA